MLYKISYQYGPDPDADYMDEPVPTACASASSEWDREYIVKEEWEKFIMDLIHNKEKLVETNEKV